MDHHISAHLIINGDRRKYCQYLFLKAVIKIAHTIIFRSEIRNAKIRNFTGNDKNAQNIYAIVTEAGGTPVITLFAAMIIYLLYCFLF